jgi:hypothetical protein
MHLGFKRSITLTNVSTIPNVVTQLPVLLGDKPASRQAVRVFFGPPGGPHKLACLGVDYDVDVQDRYVNWLSTARWKLTLSEVVIDYYTQGFYS